MTPNERIVMEMLKDWGWKPERVNSTSNGANQYEGVPGASDNIGLPDFRCSDHRLVEVKTETFEGLSRSQINRFYELDKEGYRIYIIYVPYKKDIEFHKYEAGYIKFLRVIRR